MSSANIIFPFPLYIVYMSFTCLIAQDRTSNTKLNRDGESRHTCIVADIMVQAVSLPPRSLMLAVRFSKMSFIKCQIKFPLFPSLWTDFFFLIKNGCGFCSVLFYTS